MRRLLFVLAFALPALPLCAQTVTLLHISDYHSHAEPFYTDEGERGGIARAVGYLQQQKRVGALVFSGGDTINQGSPAWSDKYGCVEWPWLNGVLDAMAFGNHDADYGFAAFEKCRHATHYPILSANTKGFPPYRVFTSRGVRVGVFAVAGDDFPKLVKGVAELAFGDPLAAARDAVKALREREKADLVVMIGHQHAEDDYAMAKAVPGIDLIFGSHSHLRRDLTRIPDTQTWYISPSQYLTYISRVQVTLADGKVQDVSGRLVAVDAKLPEDRAIARRVAKLQRELEADPKYSALFAPIGKLDAPISMSELARRTLETMRTAAKADVALSTSSSFRGSLPAGTLTMELLRAALPYDNEIVVCTMTTPQLQRVLDFISAKRGTDAESMVAGSMDRSRPETTYRVATTDYLAGVAMREVFDCDVQKSGLRVREEVKKTLQ
jgi:5'-nucleotidase